MAEEEEQVPEEVQEEDSVAEEEEEEEEVEDYQDVLKEKCAERPVCAKLKEVLEECNERVEGKEKTSETCTQELFDFVHCVDDCVSKNLFQKLK